MTLLTQLRMLILSLFMALYLVKILGGYGSDNITITKNLTGNVSTGDNADTLTAGGFMVVLLFLWGW